MIDKDTLDKLQKHMEQAGMFAQPSAAQKVMSLLQSAPKVAANMLTYLAAKQELSEMKSELRRLQTCVQQLETILEQQGPAACGRSGVNQTFTNWMVSFAESYYGLAMAFQAKNTMIPRVVAYLNGAHMKGGLFRLLDNLQSAPPPEPAVSKMLREAFEQSTKNVPGFLKP
jgi:hypothetical protein